jgi:hypothetical protein
MSWYSGFTRIGSAVAHAATGAAGKLTPGVPRVVSGVVGRVVPSAMKFAPSPLGLVDRIRASRGDPRAVLKQSLASGNVVGLKANVRFTQLQKLRKFW